MMSPRLDSHVETVPDTLTGGGGEQRVGGAGGPHAAKGPRVLGVGEAPGSYVGLTGLKTAREQLQSALISVRCLGNII